MIAEPFRPPKTLPPELTDIDNWLVWRLVQKPGEKKPRKVPFYASGHPRGWPNGRPPDGKPTSEQPQVPQGHPLDRGALASYEKALATCQRGRFTGLGLATLSGCGIVALDFDNCVADGRVDARIAELVAGTYAEISPSGTGIRAFMRGSLPSKKDNADAKDRNADGSRKDGKFDVEFFGDSGFVTITGAPTEECELFGLTDTIVDLTPGALSLYQERFGTASALVLRGDGDEDLLTLASPPLGWTLEQGRQLLFACDASASREKWLLALMAMHHEFGGSDEALDLCDEWSAQGSSYASRADVEGRWRSFGKGAHKAVTGTWLKAWARECSAHLKYDAVAERRAEIAAAFDEFSLRERICPAIAQDVRLDDMGREALAQALLSAFTKLGNKYPISQCRKLVAEKQTTPAGGRAAPPWLAGWVYVSDEDKFFRIDSDEWLTMQGFNARFNREVPKAEDGSAVKSAAWMALEDFALPTVTRARYLPWADQLFELDGIQHVNSYRRSSVPEASGALSEDGKQAVATVLQHIQLLCGGRPEVARGVVDWMAHNVQKPGVKIRWAPLIKGVEGDGKTVLGSLLAAVMGRGNVRNVSPKVLGTDFTGWAENSCVAVLEEIKLTGHNRHDILNALKPFITNDSIEVHRKGADPYDAINTTNYIAFTNFPDALPLTDTDRRWWIIFSPFASREAMAAAVQEILAAGAAQGDVLGAYFDRLNQCINTCRGDLRRWLLDWTISEAFKPNGSAPMTDEKKVMIGMSVADEELIVKDLLEKGGPGVSPEVFASSYLNNAVVQSGESVSLATSAWNHLLKRMGYTRMPKKLKWRGKTEIVWTRGHQHKEPSAVRALLDQTLSESKKRFPEEGLA